eukprot:3845267-Rhodomonas_salina.5
MLDPNLKKLDCYTTVTVRRGPVSTWKLESPSPRAFNSSLKFPRPQPPSPTRSQAGNDSATVGQARPAAGIIRVIIMMTRRDHDMPST